MPSRRASAAFSFLIEWMMFIAFLAGYGIGAFMALALGWRVAVITGSLEFILFLIFWLVFRHWLTKQYNNDP